MERGSRIEAEGKADYGEHTDKNNVRRQAAAVVAGNGIFPRSQMKKKAPVGGSPSASVLRRLISHSCKVFIVSTNKN